MNALSSIDNYSMSRHGELGNSKFDIKTFFKENNFYRNIRYGFISNSICRLIGRETYCSNIVLRMFHSIDTVTASHYPQAKFSVESKKQKKRMSKEAIRIHIFTRNIDKKFLLCTREEILKCVKHQSQNFVCITKYFT